VERFGITHFDFEDDNINLNPEFPALLQMIREDFNGKISISFMNGLSSFNIGARLMDAIKRAGVTHIDFSLVTKMPALRNKVRRKDDLKNLLNALRLCNKRKTPVTVHFILGLPGQDMDEIYSILKFLFRRKGYLGASIFYPVYNSLEFQRLDKTYQREDSFRGWRLSACFYDREIPRDFLMSAFYFVRIMNFITSISSKYNLKYNGLVGFLEKLKEIFDITDMDLDSSSLRKDAPLTKERIGVILLLRILRHKKVFRVEVIKKGGLYLYRFKEDFVPVEYVERFLRILG